MRLSWFDLQEKCSEGSTRFSLSFPISQVGSFCCGGYDSLLPSGLPNGAIAWLHAIGIDGLVKPSPLADKTDVSGSYLLSSFRSPAFEGILPYSEEFTDGRPSFRMRSTFEEGICCTDGTCCRVLLA